MPPSGRDQASFSLDAVPTVTREVVARDCRTGLLPHVVQPWPGTGLAGTTLAVTGAAESSATAAAVTPSAAAARLRAVIT